MRKLLFIVIIVFFSSCQSNEETVKGDLYFKLVNFIPAEGFSKEKAEEIEKMLDTTDISQERNKEMKTVFEYLEKLRKHKLLETPSIKLRFGEEDIKTIFLSPKEYKKLDTFSLDYLNQNNSKLEIELKIVALENDIYFSDKIIRLNEEKGKTYFSK